MCEGDCCGCLPPILKYVKDYDRFGHPVQLNFNKNGPTHNTLLGGIGSIFYYLIVFIVIITRLASSNNEPIDTENPDLPSVNEVEQINYRLPQES